MRHSFIRQLPVLLLAAFVGLMCMSTGGCDSKHAHADRIQSIAEAMIQSAIDQSDFDHPDAISPVNYLKNIRDDLRDSYRIQVTEGDMLEYDEDLIKASHSVVINTKNYDKGLRFRYDEEVDRYHIMGYWTIREP